ncbi:MAG: hypothetical protein ACYC6C_00945 [Coriobacteriia bacterium]
MKKTLITVLVIAVIATLVNDIGRYAKAYYDVDVIGTDTANTIALGRKEASRDTNARAAAEYAFSRGVTIYMYDQDERQVRVWAEMPVTGTWLWHRVTSPLKVQTQSKSYWKS